MNMRTPTRPLMISPGTQEILAAVSAQGRLQGDIRMAETGMQQHHQEIADIVQLFAKRRTERPALDRQVKRSFEIGAAAGYLAFSIEEHFNLPHPAPYVVHHYLKSDGHFSPDEAALWQQAVEADHGLTLLAEDVSIIMGPGFEDRQEAVIRGIGLISCIINSSLVLPN